jgi:hypothetical protein
MFTLWLALFLDYKALSSGMRSFFGLSTAPGTPNFFERPHTHGGAVTCGIRHVSATNCSLAGGSYGLHGLS